MQYTLVQHSGFGYGHDPGFAHAVEEGSLTTKAQVAMVEKAGGVVLDGYAQASRAENAENFPPGAGGMYPRVRGSFSKKKVAGLAIYIPSKAGLVIVTNPEAAE